VRRRFPVVKVIEYAAKFGAGITMSTNTFYMFYISLTFFHFMHVILGMVILAVIWVQARKGLTPARMRTAWRAARLTGTWSICCGSSFSLSFM
jgi:heme/copper-type cytochrome/quinol oxidase subunit 3